MTVLRLLDARTGSYAEVRPAQPGLLRVCAHVPETAGGTDISWLRVLLVADLLLRAAELRNLQVLTVLAFTGQAPAQAAACERAAGALGIHPPAERVGLREARTSPDGPIDVHLVGQDGGVDGSRSGLVVRVGAAQLRRSGGHDEAVGADVLAGPGDDPLAVRLALISLPYHQQADLTEGTLASAQETVAQWRRQVAGWAESPSRPVPARIAEVLRAAFGDLDTMSVLALLHDLTLDADVPAGAKFETFLYADRLLGLDLPSDIGRASS
ncbi:MAG TPA: hypothetical protein VED20_02250 [Streptosporangiaceae bacterium]|nr:hypothetical protein [Streptosporangiaceae bacterium]